MASALKWYQARVKARPLLTQAVTTAVLFGVGDTLAQQAVEKKGFQGHNVARTMRMVGYGGLVFGPAATKWYQFLQKNINLSSKTSTTIARVVADQTIFASTNMAIFLSTMAYLEGQSPRERLRKAYLPGLKANWLIWPGVQFANFTLVPLDQRVLVVNFTIFGCTGATLCYNSYPATKYNASTHAQVADLNTRSRI